MGGWYDGFVSWAQTVDWQFWGLMANAAAILTAAIVGAKTASSVFRSKSHSKVFDLSERIMFLVYGASEAVAKIRPDQPYLEELGDEFFFVTMTNTYDIDREVFEELQKNLPLAKAFLDNSVFDAMREVINDYKKIGRWLLDISEDRISNLELGEHYSEHREAYLKNTFFELKNFSESGVYYRMDLNLKNIERALIPILKAERQK